MFSGLNNFPSDINENIVFSWSQPARSANYSEFPNSIPIELIDALSSVGINKLYTHQANCIKSIRFGKHVIISTGTSSGKSLCYQIPILSSILNDENATALLLFPTKALSTDQAKAFRGITQLIADQGMKDIPIGVYDGDTNKKNRTSIRNSANILITNPDMLHIGLLPHHTSWERFFSNLRFVVIDEAHVYTGVFGAHFANLLRRLKRITTHYQSKPQFLLSSATIADPEIFARNLIEDEVDIFSIDDSPKSKRTFAFYNPPIIDRELGIRKGMVDESIMISQFLMTKGLQTIAFARSRVTVEMIYRKMNALISNSKTQIAPYRSGFTKSQRREIEGGLKEKTITLVIATIALELGIDMGMVDVILMNGYPGSITRFLQQAGRAGRRNKESYCIMVASSLPIDQFIIHHPDFIRYNQPEDIFLDANNPYILFNHIRCAAFELPFIERAKFGSLPVGTTSQYLEILKEVETVFLDNGKYYWTSEEYPASEISLRSIGGHPFQLVVDIQDKQQIIGEIDKASAKKFVHPGAIYLHHGDPYQVIELNQDTRIAKLSPNFDSVYFTRPLIDVNTEIIKVELENQEPNMIKGFGEIKVSERIKGFSRHLWDSQIEISRETLDLAPDILETKGGWIQFHERIIKAMSENNLWAISNVDYGPAWDVIRRKILKRDKFQCQHCGQSKSNHELHVHHKIPLRLYGDPSEANAESNLISLCKACHKLAEKNLRIVSTLTGFSYGFLNIIPVFVKCSQRDVGITIDTKISVNHTFPGVVFYDQFPGGIGLSASVFDHLDAIIRAFYHHILLCTCKDGCPSCVGPGGENGYGAKAGVQKLLELLLKSGENE
jgi:DEAD/DEAH box helicase domain-containing protein